jgi:hypothetical protein
MSHFAQRLIQCGSQLSTALAVSFQQIESHPLCRLRPDAWQASESLYQFFYQGT